MSNFHNFAHIFNMKNPYIFCLINLMILSSFLNAQWTNVGPSPGLGSRTTSIVIHPVTNTPYVLYRNFDAFSNTHKCVVKMWNGSSWVQVGNTVGTNVNNELISMAIDPVSNAIYIAYSTTSTNHYQVEKYNGTSWSVIGSYLGFIDGSGVKIALHPQTKLPYIAFSNTFENLYRVLSYNGTSWSNVGSPLGSSLDDSNIDLCFHPQTSEPYVAYRNSGTQKFVVKKFNGTNWMQVGSEFGFAGYDVPINIEIDAHNMTPYVIFADASCGEQKYRILKFTGINWEHLGEGQGDADFGYGTMADIAFSPNDDVYIIYPDQNEYKFKIKKFKNGIWVSLGNGEGLTFTSFPGTMLHPTIAFTSLNDNPYICFEEGTNGQVTVKQYNCGTSYNPFSSDTITLCGLSATLDAGAGYVNYSWNTGSTNQTVVANQTGPYIVSVSQPNGCVLFDAVYVKQINGQLLVSDTAICIGDSAVISTSNNSLQVCDYVLPSHLQNGLKAFYPFCGNAADGSGNGNHLNESSFGTYYTEDRFGNPNAAPLFKGCGFFQKSNPNLFSGNSSRTIAFWYKQTDTNTIQVSLVGIFDDPFPACIQQSSVEMSPNAGNFYYWTACNDISFANNNGLNNWNHVAFTYHQNTVTIYKNGVQTTSGPIQSLNTSAAELRIGGGLTSTNIISNFKGSIDDVAIWNRALSAQEIAQMYSMDFYTYTWSTGDSVSSITVNPTATTTYSVTVSNGISSCLASAIVNVSAPVASINQSGHVNICQGDSILLQGSGGVTYQWSSGQTSAGFYADQGGTYQVTVTDANNCTDSSSPVILHVNPTSSATQQVAACNTYIWPVNNQTYTNSGTFIDTLSNGYGCDSVVTLSLTVGYSFTFYQPLTICNGNSVTVGNNTYTTSGSYSDILTGANGCDSIVNTDLTVLDCSSIEENWIDMVNLYPNPASDMIQVSIPSVMVGSPFVIVDALGRVMMNNVLNSTVYTISLNEFNSGIYTILFIDKAFSLKFIKQ